MIIWTKKQARDFLVNYQMINTKETRLVSDVFNRILFVQFDPLNVVGTNSELVLQSRIKGFKKEQLQKVLYEERTVIDGWDKQMGMFQTKFFPYFERVRKDRSRRELYSAERYLGLEFEHLNEEILQIVNEEGPIFSNKIRIGETRKHKWGHTKASSISLSYLFHHGVIGVHSRKNSQKRFDLIERLIDVTNEDPFQTDEEFTSWYLLHRIKTLGLAWSKGTTMFDGLHIHKKAIRTKHLNILLSNKMIEEIEIEGISGVFYIPKDAKDLPIDLLDRISIIAPLDNMMWDRKLVLELFDFDYKWEVYVPKDKRKYGYYVLPLLRGSDLIGRIEFEHHRGNKPLKIINVWLEDGIKRTKEFEKLFSKCLLEFSNYLGANSFL